ncbi:MAG TPA: ACP S-malonyltransferase [Actinomycetota bacterium]|nr:ACP S-malonyltransferase [Actinomycetota bacterium]
MAPTKPVADLVFDQDAGHPGRLVGWMFPGQGSQRPGMAAGLDACGDLFAAAKELLEADLARLCTAVPNPGWPGDLLQPALYSTAVGALRALSSRGACPDAVVGHSLGEYAALTAAGALSFEDGLALVFLRGKGMLSAAQINPGGMAAVIGLDGAAIEALCAGIDGVWVANRNSPGQTVISGLDAPLAQAAEACREAGARRVVRLDVPIAGHCPLMASAAAELEEALATVELHEPVCPFYSGVDARPHTDPAEIKALLVQAMTSPVRFSETLRAMQDAGIGALVEVGPARVLCGLAKQSVPQMSTTSVGSDADAESYVASTGDPVTAGNEPGERVTVDD